MGGTDKTSWLEGMEHDEEGAFPEEGTFTESIQGWEKTGVDGLEAKTQLMGGADSDRTQLALGGLGQEAGEGVDDPVTGFLVVVQGPGLGRAVQVGAGLNVIGRSEEERVALPFGDMQISSRDHVRIIYDDEARSFMIVPGSGKNVSRLGGQIIAMPMPLPSPSVIQLSKNTRVRFVAFCGPEFDWSDVAGETGA